MKSPLSTLLLSLFTCLFFLLPATALEEGVRERWGDVVLTLKEPVVSRTVVENAARRAHLLAMEAASLHEEVRDSYAQPPSDEDCGLTLFSVTGSPAPKLRWVDQNRLQIEYAPGSSTSTEYCLEFKPGTCYLGGAPLQTRCFRFRRKPAELRAFLLHEYPGGAALLSAAHADSAEARALAEEHGGLRVCFRRMRHIPLVGWVCTGTVPATLEAATVESGLFRGVHEDVLRALVARHKPEDVKAETPLPQCLLVRPQKPLMPGARYELGVEAAPGCGFKGGELSLGNTLESLVPVLSSSLQQLGESAGKKHLTRLSFRFAVPVPEAQLRLLWEQLGIRARNGQGAVDEAARQADGSYALSGPAVGSEGERATLRLHRMLPCEGQYASWRRAGKEAYTYAPEGCAMGMEVDVEAPHALELEFSLPPVLATRHGQRLWTSPLLLRASAMPAAPTLVGSGCNEVPMSGSHQLRLPCINVESARATAYYWEAEAAARLLPLIHRGMRDDTPACELYMTMDWLRRRAAEGEDTSSAYGERRTAVGRALKLLHREHEWKAPLRARALSEAAVYPSVELPVQPSGAGKGLVQQGEALLDLDKLTCGTLRPGLYLISLTTQAHAEVQRARALYRQQAPGELEPTSCTVDYLVLVTDMGTRSIAGRLLVTSLATGEPLEGVQVSAYKLPDVDYRRQEKEKGGAHITAEAQRVDAQLQSMPQGALKLDRNWDDSTLLLLQRGEDYSLCTLQDVRTSFDAGSCGVTKPQLEMFLDRPLYRPGDVAHLRGVLRCPKKGGLSLPQACEVELSFHKPNGELMEQRRVPMDAFGAFATDFTLPEGEEDITGGYRCTLRVQEGRHHLERSEMIHCEVFRRDAFTLKLSAELDPVAPRHCKLRLRAVDYNGTPVVNGKLRLRLHTTTPLQDEQGQPLEGLQKQGESNYGLTRELPLDAEGCAEWQGLLAPFRQEGSLRVEASVANDREEQVQAEPLYKTLAPADFLIRLEDKQLRLLDARSEEPLARAQELELRVTKVEDKPRALACGLAIIEQQPRELFKRRITVPAHCKRGLDLGTELEDIREQFSWDSRMKLELRGTDADGRENHYEGPLFYLSSEPQTDGRSHYGSLKADGRNVILSAESPLSRTGRLHVLVSSQGQLRHCLLAVEAGAESLSIPLSPQEYGEVAVTAVFCEQDGWGHYRNWSSLQGRTMLPRPDKQLGLELQLPQGAKPGEAVRIRGRVVDASGKPLRAAVTLFAVDAGMMSVAPYTLPDLATQFYTGEARSAELGGRCNRLSPCRPHLWSLPDIWDAADLVRGSGSLPAEARSVYPACQETYALTRGLGSLCHERMSEAIRAAQPDFHWRNLIDATQAQYEAAPAPEAVVTPCVAEDCATNGLMTGGLRSGSGALSKKSYRAKAEVEVDGIPPWLLEEEAGEAPATFVSYVPPTEEQPQPRLRRDFSPVAVWQAALETAADGSFESHFTLPDTLTTYRVFALALGADGECFGKTEGEFLVNQPLMLTAGTPFFMSVGDKLLLPLTITNNSDRADSWEVTLHGAGELAPQQVQLEARRSTTLYFEVATRDEGSCTLQWTARSASGADAVEGSFPVRYPAPLLKEAHRLVLGEGAEATATAALLAPEVAEATRGELCVSYSTSPLIHLSGSLDFLLGYPYGCTEQRASTLLPWLFYEQLAPFCPQMSATGAQKARDTVQRSIKHILERQQEDGGLSYWKPSPGRKAASSSWASAYAALVLTIAQEQGFEVPQDAMDKLRSYLAWKNWHKHDYLTQYAVARARGKESDINRILVKALRHELEQAEEWGFRKRTVDLEFIAELRSNPAGRHAALLSWMRSKGKDYRHRSSWSGGWTIIALSEYLKLEPKATGEGSLLINGEAHPVEGRPGSLRLPLGAGQRVKELAPTLASAGGTCYVSLSVKAQPEQTDYPGVTEKGLQVTRLYEVKGEDGLWRPATSFKVGDVVRVTLTCAKIADELEYFVLEDYLPSCMEAINPNVPSQAVGLDDGGWGRWSPWFDHKEYLADRVRGFCTRWAGRDLVNMSYYARVKRAGESMAPPAEAQLMYEPQTYGLSPNARVTSVSD